MYHVDGIVQGALAEQKAGEANANKPKLVLVQPTPTAYSPTPNQSSFVALTAVPGPKQPTPTLPGKGVIIGGRKLLPRQQ